MTSSQTPRPMPKPKAPSRDEIKARVRAKVEAEKALPASERIANVLHATHSTADAVSLLNHFRAEVLREAARELEEQTTPDGVRVHTTSPQNDADFLRRMADGAEGGAR